MILGYFGNVGQGKTYGAVVELKRLHDLGYIIYSNTWLIFPYKELTLDFILDIVEKNLSLPDDCVFFIDEISIWLDSRCSMSKRNRIISYFLAQTRKLGKNKDFGLILLFTVQFSHMIDKRLKSFLDVAIESEKVELMGIKIFKQTKCFYKGKKSFVMESMIIGLIENYALYDTRMKIKYEQDRYKEEEL